MTRTTVPQAAVLNHAQCPEYGAHGGHSWTREDRADVGVVVWCFGRVLALTDPGDALADEQGEARCQYVSPSPWGPAQCVLPDGHEDRHAYSPSEATP